MTQSTRFMPVRERVARQPFELPFGAGELGSLLVEALARVRNALEPTSHRAAQALAEESLVLAREFHRQWSAQIGQLERISQALSYSIEISDLDAVARTMTWRVKGLSRLDPAEPVLHHLCRALESIHARHERDHLADAERWHALSVVLTGSHQVVAQQSAAMASWLNEIRSLAQRGQSEELRFLLGRPPL